MGGYYEGDVEAWTQAVKADPASAPKMIDQIGRRLAAVTEENDRLLSEILLLRRIQALGSGLDRLARLEAALERLTGLLDRHEINVPVVNVITASGRGMQIPAARLRAGEAIKAPGTAAGALLAARRIDEMAVITERGVMRRHYGFSFTLVDATQPVKLEKLGLDRWAGERVTAVAGLPHDAVNRYLVIASRGGQIAAGPKVTMLQRADADAKLLPDLAEDDEPVYLGAPPTGDDLLVTTRLGRWLRFPVQQSLGKHTLALPTGDQVAGAASVPKEGTVVFVAEDGEVLAAKERTLPSSQGPGAKFQKLPGGFRPAAVFAGEGIEAAAWIDEGNVLRWQSLKGMFVNILLDEANAKTRRVFPGVVRAVERIQA